jgi:hypothetical protein
MTSLPTTYDELLADAEKLAKAGIPARTNMTFSLM